jgi:hypothetical protein
LLDDTLPPDNMSARSATEIVERMKELAQNMGSAFGRLITETMVPIVARVLSIMDKKGMIQLPLKVNGLEVKIVPVSPLAKAQNLEEINEVMQFVQIAGSLGPDQIATFIADKLGIPSSLRTTPQEKQAIIQQSMQMAMQGQGMGPQGPAPDQPPMEEPASAMADEVSA